MSNCYPFVLEPLPYAYDALEPYISAETVRIHYEHHHQNYVNKLNQVLARYPYYQTWYLEKLLTHIKSLPFEIRTAVQNNGGGDYNHNVYWSSMTPCSNYFPTGSLAQAINRYYGSFAFFQQQFKTCAMDVFGSGWTWLVTDSSGNLDIINTANQDTPLPQRLTPIINLDIWEHAYYLQYQYDRSAYIDNWWHLVDWAYAEEQYQSLEKKNC